jgi:SagB-type dehydrogenase family enzyme
MFRSKYRSAWTFHRNTCRNELNVLSPMQVDSRPETYKEYLGAPVFELPAPGLPATLLRDAILDRHSCRRFQDAVVSRQDLANVLYAGYGAVSLGDMGESQVLTRTVPSGGGMYPLEFYLLIRKAEGLEPGIYHYVIVPGLLEQIRQINLPYSLVRELFMQQPYVADAAVVILATACFERTMKKYEDRGYRYILFEAGHAFQNMNLMATACGLGAFNIGGFFDADLARVLNIDMEEEIPLYAMALGVPDGPREFARVPPEGR